MPEIYIDWLTILPAEPAFVRVKHEINNTSKTLSNFCQNSVLKVQFLFQYTTSHMKLRQC